MIPQPIDQVPLFIRLAEDERELLSSRLRHVEYNTNDVIFAAGKPAEMMALVAQGWVKLSTESTHGRMALANLGAGSVIGDMDLLLNLPYSATARAASATSLLVLYRQDLQELILERPTIGLSFSASIGARVAYLDEYLVTQRLLTVPLLSALADKELRALAARLDFQTVSRGETVFQADEPGQGAFLIEEGTVRLITPSHEGQTFEEIHSGEMFGQTALITGKPYSSTARAVTDLCLWILTPTAFQELVNEYPNIQVAFSRALAETLGQDDQAKAVEQLRALPLFSDVETEALRDIAACLVLRIFPDGEMIYAPGTPGDAMYLIESGRIRLATDSNPDARVLDHKTTGQAFGEMALLTGRTRAEAAQAVEDTTVWVLYKNAYDDLIVRHPSLSLALSRALSGRLSSTEDDQIEHSLDEFKLLNGLSQFELKHVGEFVKPLTFRPGETICFAGQNAQYIYLLSQGEVREIAGSANGQAIVLNLIEEHDSFGERAVVQSAAYPTTMQAVGQVECLTIAKTDFDKLVARYPTLALNLARRMAQEADRAGQRQPLRSAPPLRTNVEAPRAPNTNGTRPPAPRPIATPRAPSMSQPVPVPPAAPGVGVRATPSKPWERPSSNVVRPMPAANSRPIGAAPVAADANPSMANPGYGPYRAARRSPGVVDQIMGLSTSAKIKLGIAVVSVGLIGLMFMIAAIFAVNTIFAGGSNNPPSQELPSNDLQGTKRTALSQIGGKFASMEKTATPIPPTATAKPKAKATALPTKKSVVASIPKTRTPAKAAAAPTQDLAVAAAAAPVRTPLPPREWDSRLGPGGLPLLVNIGVKDAPAQSGQAFWRLTKMKFQDAGAESGNDHTIYITILDENGQRTETETALISWDQGGAVEEQRLTVMDQKPKGDYCACNYNWPMYGAGYRVRVDGALPSDEPYGMIMPEHRHVNYLLTFQKMIMP